MSCDKHYGSRRSKIGRLVWELRSERGGGSVLGRAPARRFFSPLSCLISLSFVIKQRPRSVRDIHATAMMKVATYVAVLVIGLTSSSSASGFVVPPQAPNRSTRRHHQSVHVSPQPQQPTERNFISILSEDGTEQALPVASVSSFPLWVIDGAVHGNGRKRVTQVPGASEDRGWVNPRSYSELWIPEGSPEPAMKLCLGMLIKDGVPRYVMPMVDLVVSRGGQEWRNRGLNSVPIAHTWEPVGRAAAGSLFLSAYVEEKVQGSETDSMWGKLAEKVSVQDAFTDIVSVLADPPESVDLGSGFNFLVAEVAAAAAAAAGRVAVAPRGGRVRVFLTDVSEPADLLDLEVLQAVRGVAALSFDVISVANGGESEFLPEVYRPLFKPDEESS